MKIKGIELPDYLRPETVAQVKAIVKRFEDDKSLDRLDAIALNAFARDLDLFLQCDEMLRGERDNGYVQMSDRGNFSVSPYFDMRNKMERQMYAWMREFGLTMASRGKLKESEDTDSESPLADYCRGGKDD